MFLYGQKLAIKIIDELKTRPKPSGCLCAVQVGDDPVSSLYIEKKKEVADTLGVCFKVIKLKKEITQTDLISEIERLNANSKIGAIIVQLPLPEVLNRREVVAKIVPEKDVDGFSFILGEKSKVIAPTILAIDELLDFYHIEKSNQKILIVGEGFLVGKPLGVFWRKEGLEIDMLLKDDEYYAEKLRDADIVVLAIGGGKTFGYQDFKVGATIIDASTVDDLGKVRGDVSLDGWAEDKNIAPVPGGVGPVTVAMLFRNLFGLSQNSKVKTKTNKLKTYCSFWVLS